MIYYSATDDGKVQGDGTASEHVAGVLFTKNLQVINFYIHSSFRKITIFVLTYN
jgi:hypothetical protein